MTDWRGSAVCRHENPDLWFPISYRTPAAWRQINQAARICLDCPVRRDCLEYALARPELDGVWAGSTPLQRASIRRRRGYRPQPHIPVLEPSGRATREERTERRARILRLRRDGLTQREIAAQLGVTQQTVCYDLNRLSLSAGTSEPSARETEAAS